MSNVVPLEAPFALADDFAIADVLALMWDAKAYQPWSIAGIKACVAPPLALQQYFGFRRGQQPVGFFSYAFLTEPVEAAFLADNRPPTLAEWFTGERPWLMDGLAPFGGLKVMLGVMRLGVAQVAARHKLKAATLKWRRRSADGWKVSEVPLEGLAR